MDACSNIKKLKNIFLKEEYEKSEYIYLQK